MEDAMLTTVKARRKLTPEERAQKRLQHWTDTVHNMLTLRRQGAARYDEADQLLNGLLTKRPKLRAGRLVPYKDGRKMQIKDNFADKNKVYRAHGISRFEIEVTDDNGKVIKYPD
jgi:hypothetical protein